MSEIGAVKDREWLVARERGEDVSHVAAATRAPYDELGALLGKLPGMAPGSGWKQRVLAEIDAIEATPATEVPTAVVVTMMTRPQRWRRWAVAGAVVAAAAAIAIYLGTRSAAPRFGAELVVTAEVRAGQAAVRAKGERARIGDTLVVRAESPGPVELRIYGDIGEPLAACGDHGGCTVERDGDRRRLVLEVPLRARGEVHVVVFAGARLPATRGSLAADIDAAKQAGAAVTPRDPIVVE